MVVYGPIDGYIEERERFWSDLDMVVVKQVTGIGYGAMRLE